MGYEVAPLDVIKEKVIDPRSKKGPLAPTAFKWWLAQDEKALCAQVHSTGGYLRNTNKSRVTQASIFTRLFSGKPLYNALISNTKLDSSNQLPLGRPTANVCYSCTDTLVSRISQDRPQPTFLTDAGHYKERKLAKEANAFLQGELFRTNAYATASLALRDACVIGTGVLKVYPKDEKVCIERVLETELLVDYNDAYYGSPRQLMQMKLVDREVFLELFPEHEHVVADAAHGNVDSSPRSSETVADQFCIYEAWHLRSGPHAKDGRHVIACNAGILLDEPWEKDQFPFVKIDYNPNIVGWFGQSLVEILMPTQMEIYRQLIVGSQNFELMGVPRILVEEMSKILETSFNNRIGSIIKYRNTPPQFVNAPSNEAGWLPFVEWLIQNAYQISGISALSASGSKPQGLNSGEAIRSFDSIQDSRFAALAKRYQDLFTDLAYLMIDCAKDIVADTGKYMTVYPGKDGTREIDFKHINKLKDTYVIQCFEQSSLPKDPAGRQAKLSEMLAAGEITIQEFRRLSNFPDLQQSDQLAAALEERILSNLDSIIEDGDKGYKPPDPFILDPSDLATTLTVNYINKYAVTDIEDEKMDCLYEYFTQIQDLKQQAMPPQPQMSPQGDPNQGQLPVQPPNASVAPTSGVQV